MLANINTDIMLRYFWGICNCSCYAIVMLNTTFILHIYLKLYYACIPLEFGTVIVAIMEAPKLLPVRSGCLTGVVLELRSFHAPRLKPSFIPAT